MATALYGDGSRCIKVPHNDGHVEQGRLRSQMCSLRVASNMMIVVAKVIWLYICTL